MNDESIATGNLGPVYQVAAQSNADGSQPDGRVKYVSRHHSLLMPATAASPVSIPETMSILAKLSAHNSRSGNNKVSGGKQQTLASAGGSATSARPSRNASVLDENEALSVFDKTRSYIDQVVDSCASQSMFADLANMKVRKTTTTGGEETYGETSEYGGGVGLSTIRTHLRPFELYCLATLCPQSYEEAITYCPTLRDYDAGSIHDIIMLLQQQSSF